MLPIRDETRRPAHFPVVTVAIISLNVLAFIFELVNGDAFILRWSLVPAEIVEGQRLITVFTSLFMHGGWLHIIGNMIFFWAFGPEIEDAMGPRRYAVFYFAGGLAATIAQVAVSPHSTLPNLGASGAIAAVMGAFIVTYPRDRIRTLLVFGWFVGVRLLPASLLIGLWFLIQLFSVGAIVQTESGGVAYMAHIGGFIFGAVTARLFEIPDRLANGEAVE